ncbi:hypothetical protein [Mucilaginibacter aurantiaciroseus]|nr:hypothetical protein [Mucilaginibacter aurantiaciroseus]
MYQSSNAAIQIKHKLKLIIAVAATVMLSAFTIATTSKKALLIL